MRPASYTTKKVLSLGILIFCIVAWGSSYVAIKIGLESFSPTQVASYRLFVAGIISLTFVLIGKIKIPTVKQFKLIFLIGFFGIFCYHICITSFTVYFEPNVVSFVGNTAPIFILIFSYLFLRENLKTIRWIGFCIALLGIAIMNYQPGLVFDWKQLGLLSIPICGGLFFVLQKPLLNEMKSTHMIHWCIITGTLMLLLWDVSFISDFGNASLESHFAIIYMGVIPTIVAFQLWAYLLSSSSVNSLASPIYLVPPSTLFFSYIFFDHLPRIATIFGGAVTILGVMMSKKKIKGNIKKIKDAKIDFSLLEWEYVMPGLRQKIVKNGIKKIRLAEFSEGFKEDGWCQKPHQGYVVEGSFSIQFEDELVSFHQGQGIHLEPCQKHKVILKAREKAILFLLD